MKYTFSSLIHNPVAKIFIIFILVIATGLVLIPASGLAATPNTRAVAFYDKSEDEKFDRTFREGRELIDKEEWTKAAAKFNEIVCDCPGTKNADAALYWLALCYKKLNNRTESHATIERLLKNFPASSWVDDARVMMFEMNAAMFEMRAATNRAIGPASARSTTPRSPESDLSLANGLYGDAIATASSPLTGTAIDREDEIRLAAFQSLLAADPKRGVEVLGNMLKAESKASETLKCEVIRALRRPSMTRLSTTDAYASYDSFGAAGINKTLVPAVRDTLVRSFQSEPSIKVRTEIISTLSGMNDNESEKYLSQLYSSSSDKAIKKMIINSLGGGTYWTFGSFSGLTGSGETPTVASLAASSPNSNKNGHFDKLLEIVRTEKDSELKWLAFSTLQKFTGWSAKDGVIEMVAQLYDQETDEQIKLSIIRSFSGSKQNRATTKLLDIAKNDRSDKLRLAAIRSLSTSTNPEVIRFLEDLTR